MPRLDAFTAIAHHPGASSIAFRTQLLPSPRGIRYYSFVDFSGYAQAAIAYVRALVNAAVPLQWIPMAWGDASTQQAPASAPHRRLREFLDRCGSNGHLADLGTLVDCTTSAVDHDVVVIHAPPEFWPRRIEAGKLNAGCVAWETDRPPAHWLPLLRRVDRVVVPCALNEAAFRRGGFDGPIAVVPHVRRHTWCEFTPVDVAAARSDLGIPDGHRVLYTIGAWDPRKAIPDLVAAFCAAFTAADPVCLLIKTGKNGHAPGPMYQRRPTRELATHAITAAAQNLQRPVPLVVLHDEEISGDDIDLIHAVGDVYVSLSHGEGWGLGAFEAATCGKPVLMTAWGGQTDFLGAGWSGAIPYRLTPAPLWPPDRPSYFPSQRWAQADIAAAARMLRAVVADSSAAEAEALRIRERIVQEHAEPVLGARLLEALG